jgi:hypothetical protein
MQYSFVRRKKSATQCHRIVPNKRVDEMQQVEQTVVTNQSSVAFAHRIVDVSYTDGGDECLLLLELSCLEHLTLLFFGALAIHDDALLIAFALRRTLQRFATTNGNL